MINLNGALILSSINWPEDTDLTIKNPDTGLQIRGVWCGSQNSTGSYKLGVEWCLGTIEHTLKFNPIAARLAHYQSISLIAWIC